VLDDVFKERFKLTSDLDHPKRSVTLRREGEDFVVSFYPEDIVVFRNARSSCASKDVHFSSLENHQRYSGLPTTKFIGKADLLPAPQEWIAGN
jgi:hypothetical protein